MSVEIDITQLPALQRSGLGVALVPEGRRLFSDLTVAENLTVGGYSHSRADEKRNLARVFELFPRLSERRLQLSASLSGWRAADAGDRPGADVATQAPAGRRTVARLMPKMVDLCIDALKKLNKEGLAILLVEQNTNRARRRRPSLRPGLRP